MVNTPISYSGGLRFESRCRDQISRLIQFVIDNILKKAANTFFTYFLTRRS